MKLHKTPLLQALFTISLCLWIAACGSSGPQKTIDGLSKALETKDTELLKTHVDIPRLARSMAEAAQAEQEKAWKQAGNPFGMESNPFSEFIPKATDPAVIKSIINHFPESVATGQLVLTSKEKGWPWDPAALKKTTIEEVGPKSAVAIVDAPIGLRTFLSLRKGEDETWKITGFYEKKSPAVYWCSDQRISDIQAENAKRIAFAENKNKMRLAEWERGISAYKDKMAIYEKWRADCDAEIEELKQRQENTLNKIKITVVKKEIVKDKMYKYSKPEDFFQVLVKIENQNSLPATIKALTMTTSETASGTIFKKRGSSIKDILIIQPGKSFNKKMSFRVNRSGFALDEAKQIVSDVYTLTFAAETIILDDKTLDRSHRINFRDKSAKCNAYISKPLKPGNKPTPLKPNLLEI